MTFGCCEKFRSYAGVPGFPSERDQYNGGTMQIYGELAARWYRLLDPLEDHFDEAACYEAARFAGSS